MQYAHHAVKQYVVATSGCEASDDRYYKLGVDQPMFGAGVS